MPRIINALEQLFTVDSAASGPSLLISYSSAVGSFSVGETITGGTSGATLVVNTSIPPQVTGSTVTGTFQVGETITGGTSGTTATVDNFFFYDFPAGAAPLENGEIDFFESGSSTVRKTTYSDAAETIPNANPLVIKGDGRVPDVYGSGTYRIVVKTSTGIQVLARDPVGGDQGLSFGADWSSTTVYSETDVVRDDSRYWQSITDNNANNQPSTDGGINWIVLPFEDISSNTSNTSAILKDGITDWSSTITYDIGSWSRSPVDAKVYASLTASNLNNEPSVSPANWEMLSVETSDYVKMTHTLSAGTSAGTFNSGSWQTRTINTKDSDASGIVALLSNQFTLQPGDYRILASAPAANVNAHKLRLRNISDASTEIVGSASYAPAAASAVTHSFIQGDFTISTSKTFEIQHFCQTTSLNIGFGFDNASGGENAVYCVVELWRIK